MPVFTFTSSQRIPASIEEVFSFFSEARNLEAITPPWLEFRLLAAEPDEMRVGTRIDYRLKLRGVPIRWRSEITLWDPPSSFVDVQIKGPYRRWVHTHTFTPLGVETLVEDHVEYAVPGGWLVDRFFVRPDIERIFRYRRDALCEIFPPGGSSHREVVSSPERSPAG